MTATELRRQARAEALMRYDTDTQTQLLTTHPAFLGRDALTLAGMDEAGRGPLVGPVVTACVVMPREPLLFWVDDSKKLSEKRREAVFQQIEEHALAIGIGMASAREIDEINILEATRLAMRRAASQVPADVYLIDAVTGLGLNGLEQPIIKGDATSYAIAAASIVAKVTRDRLLRELDSQYPQYGFAANKGYGTAAHIAALREFGPCPEHRQTFITHFV